MNWTRQIRPVQRSEIYFWNMIGSVCNAARTVLLTVACSWLVGDWQTGVFALALATSQMLRPLGGFELRSAMVTDTKGEFPLRTVLGFQLFSSVAMMAAALLLIWVQGYPAEKAVAVLLMCLFGLIQNYSDVFGGEFQRQGHLELYGKSLSFSVLLCVSGFGTVLLLNQNLLAAIGVMIGLELAWVLCYDLPAVRFWTRCSPVFPKEKLRKLFRLTLPLCLVVFLRAYLTNAGRYAMEGVLSDRVQAIYSYLLMPGWVIALCSIFFYRPVLVPMSESWNQNRVKDFAGYVRRQIILITGCTVAVLVFSWLFGIQLLSFAYHTDLSGYRPALMIAIIIGMLSALNTFGYYVLTAMRRQNQMLLLHLLAGGCVLMGSGPAVRQFGLEGAFGLAAAVMTLLTAAVYLLIAAGCKEKE